MPQTPARAEIVARSFGLRFVPLLATLAFASLIAAAAPARAQATAQAEQSAHTQRSVRIFDLYHGEQVGEGNKSLALRLEFRAPDRTLTDEEVAERRVAIEKELESIGGHLRA